MELQHFSHNHHLVFIEEPSHESEKAYICSGCGEVISGPRFSCVKCGFHLDENCAKAPSEINHPFHRNHSLNLLASSPYAEGMPICNFCDKDCENFVYHCSCNLVLHIKCALFSLNIAEKKIGDQLQHISDKEPSISSEELEEAKCFACWNPLLDSAHLSLDCGFFLHKKCAELPLEIKHSFHLEHPLILQFNGKRLPCKICQETKPRGLVYCCSPCNFALNIECPQISDQINHPYHLNHPFILQPKDESLPCESCRKTTYMSTAYCCSICKFAFHIECISPPPVIEDEGHKHTFTVCWRQLPFICDACGTPGNCISYICLMCGFIVHKSCISLPPWFNLPRHDHRIYHTYFLVEEFKMRKCRICNVVVNTRYGSYCCRSCTYICHVDCATEDYNWYKFNEPKTLTIEQSLDSIIYVKEDGTEVRHFSHQHNLVLSDDNEDGKLCDGCILFISAPYYHCSECNFFLHKSCAELPWKKKLWFHQHQTYPHTLITDCIFRCGVCNFECSGFAYKCDNPACRYSCLRCALVDSETSQGHEHLLWFLEGKEAECNACGEKSTVEYWCNDCNFVVHDKCLKLPQIALHKCDEHPLKLTYHDDNDYVQYHYCDICEKSRNPNHWFYHCAICDTTVHPKCVLGKYTFIKPGSRYNEGDHPHRPLIFVQKGYSECHKCGKPCLDLALECAKTGCKYIVHWKCIKPFDPLRRKPFIPERSSSQRGYW
ncbi:hypothetical protein CRYUN_Cryun41cG0022100 [Craigia yunnanensis]